MNLSGLKAKQKPKPGVVDKEYVAFIEGCPSLTNGKFDRRETVRGVVFITDSHHIHTKGARGGDYWRIPLVRVHHQLCHAKGNSFVEKKYKLDFHEEVCKLLRIEFGFTPFDTSDWEQSARRMVAQAEELYREKEQK